MFICDIKKLLSTVSPLVYLPGTIKGTDIIFYVYIWMNVCKGLKYVKACYACSTKFSYFMLGVYHFFFCLVA